MTTPDNIDGTAASGAPSVGQIVTIRSRPYDVRLVDDEGGFHARFTPDDGSEPSGHYWPAGTDWTLALPRVGQRAKLSQIVERFPHFSIAVGSAGTVTEATPDLLSGSAYRSWRAFNTQGADMVHQRLENRPSKSPRWRRNG